MDDGGDRLLLRDGACAGSAMRSASSSGSRRRAVASIRTWSWKRPRPRCRPGSNGLLAIFSNVMDAKRWVQASPSFVGFDVGDPAADRTGGMHPRDRGAGCVCRRAATSRSSTELTGRNGRRDRLDRRCGQGPAVAADRRRCPRGACACSGGQGIDGAGRRPVRRRRRWRLRSIGEVAERVVRFERTVEPDPANRAIYDESLWARGATSTRRFSALSERGLARPMWWPAGAEL